MRQSGWYLDPCWREGCLAAQGALGHQLDYRAAPESGRGWERVQLMLTFRAAAPFGHVQFQGRGQPALQPWISARVATTELAPEMPCGGLQDPHSLGNCRRCRFAGPT